MKTYIFNIMNDEKKKLLPLATYDNTGAGAWDMLVAVNTWLEFVYPPGKDIVKDNLRDIMEYLDKEYARIERENIILPASYSLGRLQEIDRLQNQIIKLFENNIVPREHTYIRNIVVYKG